MPPESGTFMSKHVAVSLYIYNIVHLVCKGTRTYEMHEINSIEINDGLSTINLTSCNFRVIHVHRCIYFELIALDDAFMLLLYVSAIILVFGHLHVYMLQKTSYSDNVTPSLANAEM